MAAKGECVPAGKRKPVLASPPPPKRAFFTIISANYIAYAATLMQSLRAVAPDVPRFIILADKPRRFDGIDLAAAVIGCDALEIPLLDNMTLWYSVMELNTALKPYAFTHLLERLGFDRVIYLDPDILVLAPLEAAWTALDAHSLVLTPHILHPLQDGCEPSDLAILKSGIYNLGFCGFRRDDPALSFLGWWQDRCHAHCRADVAANYFTDQRWMDLAPIFVPQTRILRDTAYNVAYWNLAQRRVAGGPARGYTVDGAPIVFFHFSGIDPEDAESFSRHQNRFTPATVGDVAVLLAEYRALVLANGHAEYRRLPYGFARFTNGRPIETHMRTWLIRAIDDGMIDPLTPLVIGSEFFDAPDETARDRGIIMTRFMYQLWLDRPDLQRVFDLHHERGLEAFINWFIGGEAEAQGIDGRSIAAGALLYDSAAHAEAANAAAVPPPWPSVAVRAGSLPAREAGAQFHGDVSVRIGHMDALLPMQAALAWELRADLQRAYPIQDPDGLQDYLAWVLTAGLREHVVDRALLTPDFIVQLLRMSAISSYYKDVPITEAMLITRRVAEARGRLDGWLRFPTDRLSRLAHGFWFAFLAPALFDWPDVIAARVKAWFHEPTELVVGGLTLNRAAMTPWELRADLQRTFPLDDERSLWNYLLWLVTYGVGELAVGIATIDPRLPAFLAADSLLAPGVPNVLIMLLANRRDLQETYDIRTPEGRAGLLDWGHDNFPENYANRALAELDFPFVSAERRPTPAPKPQRARPRRRRAVRTRLLLTGEWAARSGRGEDLRGSVAALTAAGFSDFLVLDRAGTLFDRRGRALTETDIEAEVNLVHHNADTAYDDWRFLAARGVRAERTIGWWAWELDRLPRRWLHAFSFYDEIWASSAFARAAFAREALRSIRLVPMAVALPPRDAEPDRAALGLTPDATVFLFMFDFRSFASRKNPEGVVQAFLTAFPDPEDDVRLIVKTQGGDAAPIPWRRLSALCRDARIELRDVSLERAELLDLVAAADCFVSLHRSEGFGRGPAEAMLMGKPVIVTGYSGTMDFATADCAYVVGYRLVPVGVGEYPGAEGQAWADADIAQAAHAMRRVHEDPDAARATGARARARIQHLYAPEVSGRAMLTALGFA